MILFIILNYACSDTDTDTDITPNTFTVDEVKVYKNRIEVKFSEDVNEDTVIKKNFDLDKE